MAMKKLKEMIKAVVINELKLAEVQDRWPLEPEAQQEASPPSSKGSQPIHKEAMRFQGQAIFQECHRVGHEEQWCAIRVGE